MAARKTARKQPAVAKKRGSKGVSKAVKTAAPKRGASKASRRPARARKAATSKAATRKVATRRAPRASAPATRQRRPHPAVVHWEIQSSDPARQRDFFSNLFGWSIDANNPQDYGMVPQGGADSIPGGIGGTQDATSRVTVYVEVPDVTAVLARAEELGAATVLPRTDMGMVVMAQFRDLEGNLIGLVESDAG
jgi:predicted enzyme related to lactoylglutathione lyase